MKLSKGTTFYVKIPNSSVKLTSTDEKPEGTKSTNSPLKKYNIIIAEDDETSFYFLEQILEDVSLRIVRAKDGIEVIQKIKDYPDSSIILMDIKMPKLNGFEATEEIRKFNENVFIIAQSAYTQEVFKIKALEAGCNEYIPKPINKQKLYDLLETSNIK